MKNPFARALLLWLWMASGLFGERQFDRLTILRDWPGNPGADRILFWDQSANAPAWLAVGTNLSISGTTLNATGGGGGGGSVAWGGITGTLGDQSDLQGALAGKEASISAGTTSQYWRGDKSWQTLDKTAVGLGNVANTAQVTSVAGTAPIASSGGTTPAISIAAATSGAAGSMSASDKSKLDGIASGATANATDAALRARSSHTGTQTLSTISDAGTAAALNVPASGNAASGEVVLGSDTRLSDSRTPTSHNHAASEITSGTMATARLGSGTASSSTFLRGDQTWATPSGSGDVVGPASAVDGRIAAFDGTTGKLIKDGGSTVANVLARANHTGTQAASTITALPVEFGIACSDETTAITAGNGKVTWRAPYAFTVTAVRLSATTAPTGSTLIVDINESGTTILSTKLSLDTSEKTSTTAASAAVISDSSIADDAEITIDFDQVGSTVAGAGVKVWILGTR